jgi:hypothetical protein
MNEGSMNATRNKAFMGFLKGRSVRAMSHAKKVPITVDSKVVPEAILTELPQKQGRCPDRRGS